MKACGTFLQPFAAALPSLSPFMSGYQLNDRSALRPSPGGGWLRTVDWALVIFIIGFVYVSLPVKAAAVALYAGYILWRRRLLKRAPAPVIFYAAMIPLGALSAWAAGLFREPVYWFGWIYSAVQWVVAGAGFYLLYCTLARQQAAVSRASLKAFFAINALVSLLYLVATAVEAGVLMPYWYTDPLVRYGVNTGDQIKGVFANSSLHNSAVCVLGTLYFTLRGEARWAALCIAVLVLSTSNLLLMLLFAALLLIAFRMHGQPRTRNLALLLIPASLAFYLALSPQNAEYVVTKIAKTFNGRSTGSRGGIREAKADIELGIPPNNRGRGNAKSRALHQLDERARMRRVVRDIQKEKDDLIAYDGLSGNTRLNPAPLADLMRRWYRLPRNYRPNLAQLGKSGKYHAHKQTIQFLSSSPRKALLGAGPGGFSSKLMLKMSGLGMQGRWPVDRVMISPDAFYNHFYILLVVYYQPISEHSMIHQVSSVYNHVGGEYGLLGLALFAICYVGYFWRMHRRSFAGLLLLGMAVLLFGLDYWFEMMTLTVVFEWLMLQLRLDRVESNKMDSPTA